MVSSAFWFHCPLEPASCAQALTPALALWPSPLPPGSLDLTPSWCCLRILLCPGIPSYGSPDTDTSWRREVPAGGRAGSASPRPSATAPPPLLCGEPRAAGWVGQGAGSSPPTGRACSSHSGLWVPLNSCGWSLPRPPTPTSTPPKTGCLLLGKRETATHTKYFHRHLNRPQLLVSLTPV
jgi:hypothetical protein